VLLLFRRQLETRQPRDALNVLACNFGHAASRANDQILTLIRKNLPPRRHRGAAKDARCKGQGRTWKPPLETLAFVLSCRSEPANRGALGALAVQEFRIGVNGQFHATGYWSLTLVITACGLRFIQAHEVGRQLLSPHAGERDDDFQVFASPIRSLIVPMPSRDGAPVPDPQPVNKHLVMFIPESCLRHRGSSLGVRLGSLPHNKLARRRG